MGSYHYIDFMTDLPITETYTYKEKDLKVILICQAGTVTGGERQLTSANYPLFGHYDDYGDFKLVTDKDSKLTKLNKVGKIMLKKDLLLKQDLIVDDKINTNELMENNLYVNATSYDLYKSAIIFAKENPDTFDESYEAEFDQMIEDFSNYVKDNTFRNRYHDIPFISKSDKRLWMRPEDEGQLFLHASLADQDIYDYLLDWHVFQEFMLSNYKTFKKPYMLGRQDILTKYMRKLNELGLEEIKKLENSFGYDEDFEEDYELNDEDKEIDDFIKDLLL